MSAVSPYKSVLLVALAGLALTACGALGSPVSVADRPLSERIEERNSAQSTSSVPELDDSGQPASTPEAIAFSEALASGNFLRLTVDTNGVDTTLRTGPGTNYEQLATLTDGAEVLATGDQTGEWVFVVYGGLEGWVSNRRLTIGDGSAEIVVVAAEDIGESYVVYEVHGDAVGVNMRAEPVAKATLVSGAPRGALVVGTGRTEGSWIEISFNGSTGWSSGNYLRPVGSQSEPGDVISPEED